MLKPNANLFPTAYASILQRIDAIQPVQYAKTRNYVDGAITYLSPYISRGVISGKQVMDQVLAKGYSLAACEKLIQELAWREYFQRVWQEKKEQVWTDIKQAQPTVQHHQMISALLNGKTGIEAIDLQINNLHSIGYLHNHIRMYIASIACNIGKAHWQQPAKWMYYHLLDGDIASNNCSWQWVAGSFSSKKYFCNQENINNYTRSSQMGTYLDQSYDQITFMQVPTPLLQTENLELTTLLPATPLPNIDVSKLTLIYNSYNLDPTWHAGENVNRILLLEPSHFLANPISEKTVQFILELANNIKDLQVFCGEIDQLTAIYNQYGVNPKALLVSKEHPAFVHYPGIKEEREWMFPMVKGYFPSFFSFWKKCEKGLRNTSL